MTIGPSHRGNAFLLLELLVLSGRAGADHNFHDLQSDQDHLEKCDPHNQITITYVVQKSNPIRS